MVETLGHAKTLVAQVLSVRTFSVPTHWVGRSVPCPGQDCSMCVCRSPRQLFFVGLAINHHRAVVEIPETLSQCFYAAFAQVGGDNLSGIVVSAQRVDSRSGWQLGEFRREKLRQVVVSETEVAASVGQLYRLQRPCVGEGFVEWFDRVRAGQEEILQKCVLPGFAKNGSHHIAQD